MKTGFNQGCNVTLDSNKWYRVKRATDTSLCIVPLRWYHNLSKHYDKLLYALVTFVLIIWLDRLMDVHIVCLVIFVFGLQWCKVILNCRTDRSYRMLGDWIANGVGYILALLWYL